MESWNQRDMISSDERIGVAVAIVLVVNVAVQFIVPTYSWLSHGAVDVRQPIEKCGAIADQRTP